ncbi:MAG: DNA recombination protein RmuC [Alphaproteobacteria bacterium]|nr:DNA recombination protein RmuC [Alphaproteobacteria bacterium]
MDLISVFVGLLIGGTLGVIIGRMLNASNANSDASVALLKEQIARMQHDHANLIARASAADARVKMLEDMRGEMLKEFKNISVDVLAQTRKMANEEQTQTLNTTITPFKTQIEKLTEDFNKQIKDILKNSTENRASLESQIKNMMDSSAALKKEASDLTDALRGKKKLQGNWGEIQVERLFELLGWQPGVQYEAQKHLSNGRDIPDYIVHMPGDKHFVVDAKMSLNSYMDYLATDDAVEKNRLWRTFVDATKKHIEELGNKNYNQVVDRKFDYVCMFMPLEHAYIELMNRDKDDIYKYAFEHGVTIATPSLLLPMLRTIDTLMRVEKQSKNVSKIVEFAEKLYEKYAGFTQDYKKIGDALDTLRTNYDGGLKKLTDGRGSISGWFEKIKKQGGLTVSKNLALSAEKMDDDDDE